MDGSRALILIAGPGLLGESLSAGLYLGISRGFRQTMM